MDYFTFMMEKRGAATPDLTKTFSGNLDTGTRSVGTAAPVGDADNAHWLGANNAIATHNTLTALAPNNSLERIVGATNAVASRNTLTASTPNNSLE
ncbi:hypothetical protein LWI28_005988 [Acer negundo]|uniref:Uncharacterized protein n=1 Tax=Acer negundo TaxID=4023 RepID=A0AAD5P4K8_ACENE|nr:hypothetical protein LWI28_005988 [Acer negundo]